MQNATVLYISLGALAVFSAALVGILIRMWPGDELCNNFYKLGNMEGMSRSKIEAKAGKPNVVTTREDGKIICQWVTPTYQISILFDGDTFDEIIREASF